MTKVKGTAVGETKAEGLYLNHLSGLNWQQYEHARRKEKYKLRARAEEHVSVEEAGMPRAETNRRVEPQVMAWTTLALTVAMRMLLRQ